MAIDLLSTPEDVILCVAGDGQGMSTKRTISKGGKPTLGAGIPSMRICLHQLGGTLRIRTGRTGTVIRVPDNLASHGH